MAVDSVQLHSFLKHQQDEPCVPREVCCSALVLDLRPIENFRNGHIYAAHSFVFCHIMYRRLKSRQLTLETVVSKDAKLKSLYLDAITRACPIILYDDQSATLGNNPTLALIYDCVSRDGGQVQFLTGGYKAFQAQYPDMIDREVAPSGQSSSSSCRTTTESMLQSLNSVHFPQTPMPQVAYKTSDSKPTPPLTKVADYLYLGSALDASNLELLQHHRIRYVLNVTQECANMFDSASISYKQIAVADSHNQHIDSYFDECFKFIEEALQHKVGVLVHCRAGISRSATIVISYLMRKHRWNMNCAFAHLQSLRPCINPNLDFMGSLLLYERKVTAQMDFASQIPVYQI